MSIWMAGISHKTSSIEVREKFFLRPVEQELLLSELKNDPSIVEAVVLSTCNRTEIYAHLIESTPQILLQHLFKVKKVDILSERLSYFYSYSEEKAIRHLFSVSSGLDSLILGEKQILGQVKEALELARQKGMLGREFNLLARLAIRVGKLAQSTTQISTGGSSVCWAAAKKAESLFGTLRDKKILIIGAGKMGELAVRQFRNKETEKIFIINRTEERAQILAYQSDAIAVSFGEIKEVLQEADLCLSCAGCPHYLIERPLIEKVMANRGGKKLTLIDIAVPRNIDPQIKNVHGVELISIDELDESIQENAGIRESSVQEVKRIVEQKLNEFYRKSTKGNRSFSESQGLVSTYVAY